MPHIFFLLQAAREQAERERKEQERAEKAAAIATKVSKRLGSVGCVTWPPVPSRVKLIRMVRPTLFTRGSSCLLVLLHSEPRPRRSARQKSGRRPLNAKRQKRPAASRTLTNTAPRRRTRRRAFLPCHFYYSFWLQCTTIAEYILLKLSARCV